MSKFKKLREQISIFTAKSPSKAILTGILVFNILFLCLSALIISKLSPSSVAHNGFWASVFYTITMILDAGCIQFVVEDVGQAGVAIIIICLIIVVIGMITFTGAVIGYITNYISAFIENANSGAKKLKISHHTVIINWNSKAAEIVNELLYSEEPEKLVVLVSSDKNLVEREISDRISDTISQEYKELKIKAKELGVLKRYIFLRKNAPKNRLTIIVREGEVFSTKQLNKISLESAKSIIILAKSIKGEEYYSNSNIIKTLIQVSHIAASSDSANDQKIVVEVEDDWTMEIVNQIIKHKETDGKSNIVAVHINKILGNILAQFSIMPELNQICNELFSNKGAFFASAVVSNESTETEYILNYLETHANSVPLTIMNTERGKQAYFMTDTIKSLKKIQIERKSDFQCGLKRNFKMKKKNVIILGHNSKISSIMEGFSLFINEWGSDNDILDILVIDNEESLIKNNYFKDYPYVNNVIEADIYDREKIYQSIINFAKNHGGRTSILILSDDAVSSEEIDSAALTYLIYIVDIVKNKMENCGGKNIDVIIEVLNPRNYDVVCNYNVNNVVISNRYISKMITQIGEHDSIYDLYNDILTYDSQDNDDISGKELYVKEAGDFFESIPPKCTAYDLIRGIYNASPDDNKSIALGYINSKQEKIMFVGDQRKINVELKKKDKLILFSNH